MNASGLRLRRHGPRLVVKDEVAARRGPVAVARRAAGSRRNRWGLVLAGGDGGRLANLTRFVSGDDRPKQFCPLFGDRTLLGQTLERVRSIIPAEQTAVSLVEHHAGFFSLEPALSPSQRIVQPMNIGTAPPIVHGILSMARMDEQALVAILPSDHYFSDEAAFATVLEGAFEFAARQLDSVVALCARAEYPEVEYGWIELGPQLGRWAQGRELFHARSFVEKPDAASARRLMAEGAVWNTFVMVGHVRPFLAMIQAAVPRLLDEMGRASLWECEETHIEPARYRRIPPSSFSRLVSASQSGRLRVLRWDDAGWCDLGDVLRLTSVIQESGAMPGWFEGWSRKRAAPVALSKETPATAYKA